MPPIEETDIRAIATEPVGELSGPRRRRPRPLAAARGGLAAVAAVGVKELRGRVRGRRAFVILTFYLLFLGAFAWAWELVAERMYVQTSSLQGGSAAFASALVGQEVFGALVLIETLLVVFLAPAFTAGAISLEREKQTLDMLAATPISSLAIVIGKLISALAWVFVLIAASIPLTALVFVFGGVGPDDVIRAYAVLVVSALGLGSAGLFISALTQRTQAATVVTFFAVLFLTMGSLFGVLFWNTMANVGFNGPQPVVLPAVGAAGEDLPVSGGGGTDGSASGGLGPIQGTAPEAFLWFNPFAAEYDVICGASDGYGGWCSRLNTLTKGAISITGVAGNGGTVTNQGFGGVIAPGGGSRPVQVGPALAPEQALVAEPQPFGVRRDTFWPRSLIAWLVASVAFILASVQLVSPTRRWRIFRRPTRRNA